MPCSTCNGFGYVRLIHRGHGSKDYSRPLVHVGGIRWHFADYGVQTCYCPTCSPAGQTVAAKRHTQERVP